LPRWAVRPSIEACSLFHEFSCAILNILISGAAEFSALRAGLKPICGHLFADRDLEPSPRTHMRSITSIPSKWRPRFKVRAVRSQRARRLARRSGDSAFNTGHSSKNVLNLFARSNR
jgi:hypothetical protein